MTPTPATLRLQRQKAIQAQMLKNRNQLGKPERNPPLHQIL